MSGQYKYTSIPALGHHQNTMGNQVVNRLISGTEQCSVPVKSALTT